MLKTMIHAVVTLLISVGGFMSALNAESPWMGFSVAFGIVVLFFWNLNRRWKKADERKIRERMFEEYMRRTHPFRRY